MPFSTPFEINTARWIEGGGSPSALLISSNGRYIWSGAPVEIKFDGSDFIIGSYDRPIEVVNGGRNLREAYLVACHRNFPPTGQTPSMEMVTMPMYDLSMEFDVLISQQAIVAYADRLLAEGFPAGILLLPDGWNSVLGRHDFDNRLFPRPKEMVDLLHSKGFKVMLTLTPYVVASGRTFFENIRLGNLLSNRDGTPVLLQSRQGFVTAYDLRNKEHTNIMRDMATTLQQEFGIDGFRIDSREVFSGLNGNESDIFLRNLISAFADIPMCEFLPGSGIPMAPQIYCLTNSVTSSTTIAKSLNDIIGVGLSAFPYLRLVSEADPATDLSDNQHLMLRISQLSIMMPSATIPFTPWRITDPALYEQLRNAVQFRFSINSYITELVNESARTAEPVIRNMEYVFPRSGFSDCDNQYMIGNRYLCVPVSVGESQTMVRFPRGTWEDMSGRRFRGPLVTTINASDGRMLVFESTAAR